MGLCRWTTFWEAIHWACHTWWDMATSSLKKYTIEPPLFRPWIITRTTLTAKGALPTFKAKILTQTCWLGLWLEDPMPLMATRILETSSNNQNQPHILMLLSLVLWRSSNFTTSYEICSLFPTLAIALYLLIAIALCLYILVISIFA